MAPVDSMTFEAFVELQRPHAIQRARVPDRGTAEEVVDDAFVALDRRYEALQTYEARMRFLSVVLRRRGIDWWRTNGVTYRLRQAVEFDVAGPATGRVDAPSDDERLLDAVEGILNQIFAHQPQRRKIAVLRYVHGLTCAEISVEVGPPTANAVRALINRPINGAIDAWLVMHGYPRMGCR